MGLLMHLTKKGGYLFSFNLKDGFYALGNAEADRDHFTVDIRGTLYRLAELPMGWSLSPYYFTIFTERVLDALGLQRHAEKGFYEPAQFVLRLGINIDSMAGVFYATEGKLLKSASHAKQLLSKATRNARWLPDIRLRARYIRSAANVWADRLSRHMDSDDWQVDPVLFAELDARFGPRTIDQFTSALNALLPR
eukprot:jgi/Tetstr1/440635/TSEL_028945.t1